LYNALKYPIVIDGRNLYDPEVMGAQGFSYYSVGRPAVMAETQASSAAAPARKFSQA
jgi:UDPglucose 6-dehydrogenase